MNVTNQGKGKIHLCGQTWRQFFCWID